MNSVYKFNPHDSMTAKEVADIMTIIVVSLIQAIQQRSPTGTEPLEIDEAIYINLPEELKKYFEKSVAPPQT